MQGLFRVWSTVAAKGSYALGCMVQRLLYIGFLGFELRGFQGLQSQGARYSKRTPNPTSSHSNSPRCQRERAFDRAMCGARINAGFQYPTKLAGSGAYGTSVSVANCFSINGFLKQGCMQFFAKLKLKGLPQQLLVRTAHQVLSLGPYSSFYDSQAQARESETDSPNTNPCQKAWI